MLSGYADSLSNIHLGIKLLVPLVVRELLLVETIQRRLLVVHCGKRILFFRLGEHGLFN